MLRISTIRQAIEEPLTIGLLSAPAVYEYEDGTREPGPGCGFEYAKDYVVSMIDYICNSYQRKEPMTKEDRRDLAELIIRRNPEFTIADCRLFADMVVSNDLPTGRPGMEERRLIDVNKSGILDKLSAYKARRAEIVTSMSYAPGAKQNAPQKEKDRPLTEWQLTHDYEGNEMPAGWDAETYWKSPAPPERVEQIIIPRLKAKMRTILNNISK